MVSESKVLLHRWHPSRTYLVRGRDIGCSWPRVKVQVNASAKRSPRNIGRVQSNLLSVRIAVVQTMRVRYILAARVRLVARDEAKIARFRVDFVVSRVEVERVRAVDVEVNWVTSIRSVYGL